MKVKIMTEQRPLHLILSSHGSRETPMNILVFYTHHLTRRIVGMAILTPMTQR